MNNPDRCPICGNSNSCACDTGVFQSRFGCSADIVKEKRRERDKWNYQQVMKRDRQDKIAIGCAILLVVVGVVATVIAQLFFVPGAGK